MDRLVFGDENSRRACGEHAAPTIHHIIRSASVEFARSDRARTRCFVDTCQLGAFARSAIIGVAFPAPSPTLPRKRGRERTEFVHHRALPLLREPALILHAAEAAH